MNRFVESLQRVFGWVLCVAGIAVIALPFIYGEDRSSGSLLLLGLLLMVMGCFVLTLDQLEKERKLLNSPLKVDVLLTPKGDPRQFIGVIYVDRRTGALSAPVNDAERVLKHIYLGHVGHLVLRAPYFWENRGGKTLHMINADYVIPPKS